VCVIVDGAPVVDLWGGIADEDSGQLWRRDTLNVICSCTKGAVALCANMLIDQGQLDPSCRVADYWPEFGQCGKDAVTVRHVLTHQSGVCHWDENLGDDGILDPARVIRALERTPPYWEPGTRQGYHGFSFGYLVGELVRRISGLSVGDFFQNHVARPLGVDFWIGLPEHLESRVATTVMTDPRSVRPDLRSAFIRELCDRNSLAYRMVTNDGGWARGIDQQPMHATELPSAGGITNARGLAGMYAPLALDGAANGVRILKETTIAAMRTAQAMTDRDAVTGALTCFTLGFAKSWPNGDIDHPDSLTLGEDAFGMPGVGGQVGFADPAYRMAFAYTMNRHGTGVVNERGRALIDATYRALGCSDTAPGFWVRPR
jgi:CubicO group peptidase (beta-lactamase class C family)